MLGEPRRFEATSVRQWVNSHLGSLPRADRQTLTQHLNDWLALKHPPIALNQPFIQAARQKLSNLSLSQRLLLQLEELPTPANDPYDPKRVSEIEQRVIPDLARQMTEGDDWVIGLTLPPDFAKSVQTKLIEDAKRLYAQRYTQHWVTQLSTISMPRFDTLAQANNVIEQLLAQKSSVSVGVAKLKAQLEPMAKREDIQDTLRALDDIQAQIKHLGEAGPAHDALVKLHAELNGMLSSNDPAQATLSGAQRRFRETGQDALSGLFIQARAANPPISSWLQQLGDGIWRIWLRDAQNQLNALWITEVLPNYQHRIKQRYPIFSDANADISLKDFSRFFGPQGTMNRFFSRYLADFIDTRSLYWQWKSLDGAHLNIPQDTLEMLNRAALIQQMFYPDSKSAEPSFTFTLKPIGVPPTNADIALFLEGVTIDARKNLNQVQKISTPAGRFTSAHLSLHMNERTHIPLEEIGEWATLKLLSKGVLKPNRTPKDYTLSFTEENQTLTCQLTTQGLINPLVPGLLTGFRCPERL